jgi:hypothetical protein
MGLLRIPRRAARDWHELDSVRAIPETKHEMYHCFVHGPRPVAKSVKVVDVGVTGAPGAQPATTIKHAAISFDIDRQTSVGDPK